MNVVICCIVLYETSFGAIRTLKSRSAQVYGYNFVDWPIAQLEDCFWILINKKEYLLPGDLSNVHAIVEVRTIISRQCFKHAECCQQAKVPQLQLAGHLSGSLNFVVMHEVVRYMRCLEGQSRVCRATIFSSRRCGCSIQWDDRGIRKISDWNRLHTFSGVSVNIAVNYLLQT